MNGLVASLAATTAWIALVAGSGALPAAAVGPDISSAPKSWFTAVGASSPGAAFAVGTGGKGTYAARWNGKIWKQVPTASPAGNAVFYGVAATSARQAWAVGNYSRRPDTLPILIEHWNGSAWQRTPVTGVASGGSLLGVAATSARNAWAVGEAGDPDNGYTSTLILHWNGTAWKKVDSPGNVAGASSELLGVAAVSASDAWAVGDSGPVGQPLILHWNGRSWAKVASPSFTGGADLNAVAATSKAVWAVGTASVAPYHTVILRWSGSSWARVPSPSPTADGGSQLYAVAGVGKTVWTVGYAGSKTLIERWNGATWTRVLSPSPGKFADLAGIAAVSASNAWAVGQDSAGPLLEHWNGSAWQRLTSSALQGRHWRHDARWTDDRRSGRAHRPEPAHAAVLRTRRADARCRPGRLGPPALL
jgi:hypothetical protein